MIEQNPAYDIFFDGEICRLTINEIFPEDSGTFKCEAKSDFGSAQTTCVVKVEQKGQLQRAQQQEVPSVSVRCFRKTETERQNPRTEKGQIAEATSKCYVYSDRQTCSAAPSTSAIGETEKRNGANFTETGWQKGKRALYCWVSSDLRMRDGFEARFGSHLSFGGCITALSGLRKRPVLHGLTSMRPKFQNACLIFA